MPRITEAHHQDLVELGQRFADYRAWVQGRHDRDGELIGTFADFDEARVDWLYDLVDATDETLQLLGYLRVWG